MKYRLILVLVCVYAFCSVPSLGRAQETQDSSKVKNLRFFAIPLVYYSPETRWGFGAGSIFTFRFKGEKPDTRVSQFQIGGAYTQNKQLLLYLPFQLFLKDAKYYLFGELGYYNYNYFFYGIGNDFSDYDGELYDVNFPRIRVHGLYRFAPNCYVGLHYWFDDYEIPKIASDGLLDTANVPGANGGRAGGIGPMLVYDSRDQVIFPTKGWYVESALRSHSTLTGSDFAFTKFSVDARYYLGWGNEQVLALNAYAEATGGDAPFNQLALIGGNKRMRGYYEGRVRDNQLLLLQAEYRFPLFWRLGATIFGGYGGVADRFEHFQLADFNYTLGAGLRIILLKKDKVRFRIDYGIGKNTSGVYVTVGEAF